ncbi:MAG: hypothetical protein WBN06_01290 [Lysobacterales bacterium]
MGSAGQWKFEFSADVGEFSHGFAHGLFHLSLGFDIPVFLDDERLRARSS